MKLAHATLVALLSFIALPAAAVAQPAIFTFTVPPDAKIVINNHLTRGTGEIRRYSSHYLAPGQWYVHRILVTVERDGRSYSKRDVVLAFSGDQIRRSYLDILNDAEFKSYPKPPQIPVELLILDEHKRHEANQIVGRAKSKQVLDGASEEAIRQTADLERVVSAVTEGPPLDIEPSMISDVAYERVSMDLLRVTLEVRRSSKQYRQAGVALTVRDTDRYVCIYNNKTGDWVMNNYWTTRGDTAGDLWLRWENTFRRFSAAFPPTVAFEDPVGGPQ